MLRIIISTAFQLRCSTFLMPLRRSPFNICDGGSSDIPLPLTLLTAYHPLSTSTLPDMPPTSHSYSSFPEKISNCRNGRIRPFVFDPSSWSRGAPRPLSLTFALIPHPTGVIPSAAVLQAE